VRGGTPRFTGNVYLRDLAARTTTLLSVGRHGEPANSDNTRATVSADGRFVAFASAASNLVAGDTNGAWDVFVYDRKRGTTERVSVGPGGAQGNGDSGVFGLALSGNGRRVAFVSEASNLVGGDRNGVADIFVRDLDTGTTRRVSVGPGGIEADSLSVFPSFSADGRYVAFDSIATNLVPHDRNGQTDVFVHDLETGTTTRASVAGHGAEGDATSAVSSLSANGHAVAFQSEADNLVPGDTDGHFDVFVRYR